MHTKNKLGIYVYLIHNGMINNNHWCVNSISHGHNFKGRFINYDRYGIHLLYIKHTYIYV